MPRLTETIDERLGAILESYEAFDAWTLKWWTILITIPIIIWGYICMLGTFKSLLLPPLFSTLSCTWATVWIFLWPIVGLIISSLIWASIAYLVMKIVFNFFKWIYWDIYKTL